MTNVIAWEILAIGSMLLNVILMWKIIKHGTDLSDIHLQATRDATRMAKEIIFETMLDSIKEIAKINKRDKI
jgi:hypothetical protein